MVTLSRLISISLVTGLGLLGITSGFLSLSETALPDSTPTQDLTQLKTENSKLQTSPILNSQTPMIIAQQPTFTLDGKPVYVLRDGQWREAQLTGWRWASNTGERYNVLYLDNNTQEQGVTVDRIRSLADAQRSGVRTNVYDLSSQAGINQMVSAHNQWRSRVNVPPLTWSPTLANYAQEWANKLLRENKFEHRSNSPYGENLAAASGQQMSPARVVDMWGNEVRDYNYQTNRCAANKVCGHYTQVVWRNTREVGCGMARNSSREVWVCNYNPPGNFVGQKPY